MIRSVADRGSAVAFGDLTDRAGLGLGPPEDLQRGQAGDDVEEVAGQSLQDPELAVHAFLRRGAHQGHEQRDQRDREGDDRRRDPVVPEDHHNHDDGHDHGEEQLRQVQREVAVERVDPAGGEHRQLAGALLARIVQAERRDALQQGGA